MKNIEAVVGFVGIGLLFFATNGLANPRPPLPQIPEFVSPIYQENFDAGFYYGITNAQLTSGNYILDESWSGYALQRSGAVIPFIVLGIDPTGHTNISCNKSGAIRFWFKPDWSNASIAGGTGPGATAQLLELNAVSGKQSAVDWSLQVNPDGNTVALLDPTGNALLKTPISWSGGQSHLITLNYSPKLTVLFVDAELVAQGTGVTELPPNLALLMLGSTLAGVDFDELSCFGPLPATRLGRPARTLDPLFYWNYSAPYAALGPVSAEEIAAREKRIAERKAQAAASKSASSQESRSVMEAMAARSTCGPLDASVCVTNGPVYMTNVMAGFETNGTMTVMFNLVGGTNGLFYDIFTTTNLAGTNAAALQWTWLARGPTCHTYQFTNQPSSAAFYMVGTPQDTDGDGLSDAFEQLVSKTDPLVGVNRIQTENAITGTTNWMLINPITATNLHGWPTKDADTTPEIQGFASATSVNVGDTIDLYVDVRRTNDTHFTLEIFRLGWYGGQGGRKMTWTDSGQPTNTMTLTSRKQPLPQINQTNGLIDCLSGLTTNGTDTNLIWQRSYTLALPTNWVSGMYVARLTTGTNVTPQTTGKQSYIIFTVRDDARSSDLLYQASVTTWQAYNPWGGSSLYAYPKDFDCYLHVKPNAAVYQFGKVSFNRPYAPTTCAVQGFNLGYGSGAGEFFTMINFAATPAWEYNMVRWLERQGYDVTYSTSVDTHRVCPANKGVKTFLSVGHDEYWSAPMRANVEAARDRGVNLCFFSANVCYWQIHFQDNERVFSVDKRYTSGTYYDRWRGAATVNNPEISMIGEESFYINGPSGGNSNIRMPATLPSGSGIGGYHWAYDYSGLTNGQTLPLLLGHEADGCWDTNPPCVCHATPIEGSPCPGSNTVRLADSPIFCGESCGPPIQNQSVTNGHSYITLHAACNGAQVFATGSIQWSWGLDDFASQLVVGPGTSRVHPGARQMTHNVLRTFSGRPTAPVIFANADSSTSGIWTNGYGTNYFLADTTALTNLPSYALVTLSNQQVQVWANPSSDPRALLIPGSSNRIASAWTTTNLQGSFFTIDVNLTDTNAHQVALYCVDWLGTGSVLEKIEVFDYADTSHPLDTRNFQLPPNGVYLTWKLKGRNIFRITKPDATTGNKAMISGLFIGY